MKGYSISTSVIGRRFLYPSESIPSFMIPHSLKSLPTVWSASYYCDISMPLRARSDDASRQLGYPILTFLTPQHWLMDSTLIFAAKDDQCYHLDLSTLSLQHTQKTAGVCIYELEPSSKFHKMSSMIFCRN